MAKLTKNQYPLGSIRQDLLETPTGKSYNSLTLERAINGEVQAEDLRIGSNTLLMQAEIAESEGRNQLAKNFRRAAELINISDDRILEIYNALRPNVSTKDELLSIARELEEKYEAFENAKLVQEAASVYERRDLLRKTEEVQ
ncbi:diol dehydratase small subunit [Alteribacillus sp. JSM 102045]|uniref:diol dehydratase small subunit n=1 Tax=Alteribacillus sp. JSM 102045 TaxID=1562101 RepID=UPI0035C15A96